MSQLKGRGDAIRSYWVEARDVTKYSTMHQGSPTAKNYLAPNADSAKVENPWSKPEVRKLQPKGQIQSTTCVSTDHKLRMVFTFLNGWKKKSKEQ